ncbi:hypothetical protein BN1080_03301 [Planococcus massiliensis]|uniref:Uncharacterized protein n=1 Tax=Planococcus massiliensis TaxID=1499687 RepID=A0A098EPR6_9BACL|nr:hypothetical protein [Planococcus massiliensis]CEG24279.1 hypothetical protein BN1080_03301 [Planococcus massiliensis]
MKKVFYTYDILLTTGEWLRNIRMEGALEDNFPGVAVSFIQVETEQEKPVALNMYHIVKAELIRVEEF